MISYVNKLQPNNDDLFSELHWSQSIPELSLRNKVVYESLQIARNTGVFHSEANQIEDYVVRIKKGHFIFRNKNLNNNLPTFSLYSWSHSFHLPASNSYNAVDLIGPSCQIMADDSGTR